MSLEERRVLESDRSSLNVKAVQGSRLTGTVQENKNVFDRLVEFIIDHYNDMIDDLTADTAASEIGAAVEGVEEKTVQGVLNKHDADIKNRYTKAETDALMGEDTKDLLESFDVDLSTGVITVVKKDGTTQSWDTALEKIPASFAFVEDGGYFLQVTNEDGTSTQVDVSALMNHYSFDSSNDVAFAVTGEGPEKRVSATVRANSIGIDKLSLSAVSQLETYATGAAQSAAEAEASKLAAASSEEIAIAAAGTATAAAGQVGQDAAAAGASGRAARSFAKGDTNTREGEETDNAEYYSIRAKLYCENSSSSEVEASLSKTAAASSESNAKASEAEAKNFANLAASAKTIAEASAETATSKASVSENSALASATSASDSASFADAANDSAASASNSASTAKADADRAKAAADRAEEVAGGDFATKTEVETAKAEAVSDSGTNTATLISAHNISTSAHAPLFDQKVDKENGKALSTNDYTTQEKTKLSGVDEYANNYTHPASHSAGMISQDSTHRFVTDSEKSAWTAKVGSASFSATLPTAWVGSSAPYTQVVSVSGLKITDKQVHVRPVYSAALESKSAEKEAWNLISDADVTGDGYITFYCFEEKTAVTINIKIEVIR